MRREAHTNISKEVFVLRINNNIMAMNTHRQLGINQTNSSKSLEKLSSGLRINRAGDDAAGLAISEKMRAQIRIKSSIEKRARWYFFNTNGRRGFTRDPGYFAKNEGVGCTALTAQMRTLTGARFKRN